MKRYVIDRFEGMYVILEDENTLNILNILRTDIPRNAREGDILKFEDGKYVLLTEETKQRRKSIQDRFNKLRK